MSNDSKLQGDTPIPQPAHAASPIEDGEFADDPSVRNHPRYAQMFPVLTEAEIERVRRFGSLSRHARGSNCSIVRERFARGCSSCCRAMVRIVGRDGLGHERTIHTYTQRGDFTSDVTQLSNQPAVVDAHVVEDVEALLLRPDELSAMMISEADLGEKIMRALILRRVLVIERGQGVILVGSSGNARLLALQNFLRRNAFPNMTLDAEQDAEAVALLERLTPQPDDFPLVVCPDGTVLRNPDEGQLASCLGLIPEFDPTCTSTMWRSSAPDPRDSRRPSTRHPKDCRSRRSTVAHPAARPARVRASRTIWAFPTGITGHALAGRAFVQAQKFGAHIGIPCEVRALYCDLQPPIVELADGAAHHRPHSGHRERRGVSAS